MVPISNHILVIYRYH